MRAALCKTYGGPELLEVGEVPDPEPGPGEVLIRVEAAALNYFDTLIIRDKYQFKPKLPFPPSAEIAGRIERLGEGVTGFTPGERVMTYVGWGERPRRPSPRPRTWRGCRKACRPRSAPACR